MPRCLLSLSLALWLMAPAAVTAAPGRVALQPLALKTTDLPRGFRKVGASFFSNAQAARSYGVSVATLNAKGRLLSYQENFFLPRRHGGDTIINGLVAYKGADGARWEYTRSALQAARIFRGGRQFAAQSLRSLGDERSAVVAGTSRKRGVPPLVLVVFRRGDYVANVLMDDVEGIYSVQEVIHLASLVDRRIQTSG